MTNMSPVATTSTNLSDPSAVQDALAAMQAARERLFEFRAAVDVIEAEYKRAHKVPDSFVLIAIHNAKCL